MTRFLTTLSPSPKLRQFLYSFLILLTLLSLFSCVFLGLGCIDLFWGQLERLVFSLGAKGLAFPLRGLGLSGGLSFALYCVILFMTEDTQSLENRMMMSGSSNVAPANSGGTPSLPAPSSRPDSLPDLNDPAPALSDAELAFESEENAAECDRLIK